MNNPTEEEKQENLLKKWNTADNNGAFDPEDFHFLYLSDEDFNEINFQQFD